MGASTQAPRNNCAAVFTNASSSTVSSPRRYRQYAGLALVLLAYLGGILGWSWAVQTVETDRSAPADTTAVETSVPALPGPATDGAVRLVPTDSQ